jgi:hypothetical protein
MRTDTSVGFNADLIRKLAINYPECANGLIRSCKIYNRWITDDNNTISNIKEIFSKKWCDKLQILLHKFFSPDLRHIYTNSTNNHHAIGVPVYDPDYQSYLENLKVSTQGAGAAGGIIYIGDNTNLCIKLVWNINNISCIQYTNFKDFYSLFENTHQKELLKKIGTVKNKFMKTIVVLEEINDEMDEMMGILTNLEHIISKGRNYWYKKNDDQKSTSFFNFNRNKTALWPDGVRLFIAILITTLILGKVSNNYRKIIIYGCTITMYFCVYFLLEHLYVI